ncbi:hypothetical protein ACFO3J_18330 [Streptomyces polygonati]|uniref:Secreted protein n=1 Tax=Streptomyces polygonati TaxID=1617087 RepID=A0ABV8HR49_9ACTN
MPVFFGFLGLGLVECVRGQEVVELVAVVSALVQKMRAGQGVELPMCRDGRNRREGGSRVESAFSSPDP